jgi:hypothetical protein
VELGLAGLDYRLKPLRKVGFSRGCDQQDFGSAARDAPGLRVGPLTFSVDDREALGKVGA